MSDETNKRVYPSSPLEENIAGNQQQPLIAPKAATAASSRTPQPPSYEQAIGETTPAVTAGPNVIVITEPVSPYGPHPIDVQCPYCHNYCRTRLRYKPTSRTHLIALLLCLFQLYCCICLPYCIRSCMNTNHYCGMCDKYLGTYKR
ncbi:lipopolysaccharide-induced tumor necrosis factor-alpha factor homolog [Cochliomyia hominivorax]